MIVSVAGGDGEVVRRRLRGGVVVGEGSGEGEGGVMDGWIVCGERLGSNCCGSGERCAMLVVLRGRR